jgi:preprotein translocase subunit YajC
MEFLPLVALALLFWVFVLRPQRRRRAEQTALWADLHPGEEVVTLGGLYGKIDAVDGDSVRLRIAPETVVRVDRRAVARRVEPPSAAENPG